MTRYTSTDNTVFEITSTHYDDALWVNYRNVKTGQEYSCLAQAFFDRFFETVA